MKKTYDEFCRKNSKKIKILGTLFEKKKTIETRDLFLDEYYGDT